MIWYSCSDTSNSDNVLVATGSSYFLTFTWWLYCQKKNKNKPLSWWFSSTCPQTEWGSVIVAKNISTSCITVLWGVHSSKDTGCEFYELYFRARALAGFRNTCCPDVNLDRCCGMPATNRLSYSAPLHIYLYMLWHTFTFLSVPQLWYALQLSDVLCNRNW
jgi:hypothetical protein